MYLILIKFSVLSFNLSIDHAQIFGQSFSSGEVQVKRILEIQLQGKT